MGTAADEGRHVPDEDPEWAEVFDLHFWTDATTFGGFARFELRPHDGVCWFWTALVGRGPLTTVLEFDSDLPRWPGLELRGPSLWSEMVVETPLEHVSLGLEAFAVALADPAEVFRGARGDLVPLGYDLEWESVGPAEVSAQGQEIPCAVHGEILLGDEVIAFDGSGRRGHWWGEARSPSRQVEPGTAAIAPVERPDGTRWAWVLDPEGPHWGEISRSW